MTDSPPPVDERTTELINLKSELSDDFHALAQNSNEIYNHHLALLEQIREQKLASLEQWRANETASAERHHRSQSLSIENDVEEGIRATDERILDFLAFKLRLLREKFPDAAKYFDSQNYQSPAQSQSAARRPRLFPDVDIKETDEPLIAPKDREDDLALVAKIGEDQNRHGLANGLATGDPAVLRIGVMPPIPGVLGSFEDDHLEFVTQNERILRVKWASLQLGHAAIEPQ